MSKIGKKTIQIPKGVDVKFDKGLVTAKGPKGELKIVVSESIMVSINGDQVMVSMKKGSDASNLWGLTRALIANVIKGVNEGFEKTLEFQGVGYKAIVKGEDLELNLGYSHPIHIKAPSGILFKVEKNTIKIIGVDK